MYKNISLFAGCGNVIEYQFICTLVRIKFSQFYRVGNILNVLKFFTFYNPAMINIKT
jgi:hypothetical protein